ncbi:MAG: hypothetical protein WC748_05045 [Legionellales bacterium]
MVPKQTNSLSAFYQETYNIVQEGFNAFTALEISAVLSGATFAIANELNKSTDDTRLSNFYLDLA